MRLDGGLFFATADALEEGLRGLAIVPGAYALVLDSGESTSSTRKVRPSCAK